MIEKWVKWIKELKNAKKISYFYFVYENHYKISTN